MTATNILAYLAILAFMVYRRVQGRPAGSLKQLFVLPAILCVLGYQDLAHKPLDTIDIVVAVAGSALSLALGAVRGILDNITTRDGVAWVRWGTASVVVFAINIAAKVVLDVVGVAAGGTSKGVAASLVLAAGLMLIGEAAVVFLRIQTSPHPAITPHNQHQRRGELRSQLAATTIREPISRLGEHLLRRLADRRVGD